MRFEALKVGELAKRTGLTVRTLYHYDAIGLLTPSQHTEAGYRLYTADDVARLQQVLSLRQLGFSLDEVRGCLDRPGFSPLEVIGLHVARLREQIDSQRQLCQRLETLTAQLRAAGEVSADEFLDAIVGITMLETLQSKYFTPEQMQAIKQGREQAGPESLGRMQDCWAELIALIRAEMERGTDPADPTVQALARRWQALLHQATGSDPGIQQAMKRHWEEQGDTLAARFGSEYDSRPIWGYFEAANRHRAGTTAENSFASFDGTRIAYSDQGEGPAVVLLHGFGTDGRTSSGTSAGSAVNSTRSGRCSGNTWGSRRRCPSRPPRASRA